MDLPLTPKTPNRSSQNSNSTLGSPLISRSSIAGASQLSSSTPSLRVPSGMSLDISSDSGGASGDEFAKRRKSPLSAGLKRDRHPTYYKDQTPFGVREVEAGEIRKAHPGKVPVIVERHKSEKVLPILNKIKFLVPQELTISHLLGILRSRISINSIQSIYLLLGDGKTVCNLSCTICEAYQNYKDPDGFLYMKYASQEFYG